MSTLRSIYEKTRAETARMFKYDLAHLTDGQNAHLEVVTALRLGLDDLQGRIVRGEAIDTSKLVTISESLARMLPPSVLAAPPAAPCEDPRAKMLRELEEMQRRGELGREFQKAQRKAAFERENAALRAENEVLRRKLARQNKKAAASGATNVVDLDEAVRRNALREDPPRPPQPGDPEPWRDHLNADGSMRTGAGIFGDWSDRRT
jgi:hypothetical protein